ncbi:MAG: hypothetical protein LBG28_09390 [Tannerella sp.]|nr:hypothetical protein [Tannerella sp.]
MKRPTCLYCRFFLLPLLILSGVLQGKKVEQFGIVRINTFTVGTSWIRGAVSSLLSSLKTHGRRPVWK